MAEIWMVFGAEEYKYGTYRFITCAEKNRVNNLAMKLREERGCETYVKEIGEYQCITRNVRSVVVIWIRKRNVIARTRRKREKILSDRF